MSGKLTKKHQIFVAEYLACFDATKAALAAGYSPKTAQSQGCQLLKHPKVSAEITKKTEKRLEKLDITADYVLQNIVEVGERCMQKRWPVMVGQGKHRKQLTEVVNDPETGDPVEAEVFEFDSLGALKAQELLGKHLKLFTDKIEATGKDGGPIVFQLRRIGGNESGKSE